LKNLGQTCGPSLSQFKSLNFKKMFTIQLGIMRHLSLDLTRVRAPSIEMEHSCCLRAWNSVQVVLQSLKCSKCLPIWKLIMSKVWTQLIKTRNVHGIGSKGPTKQSLLVFPSKKTSNFGLTLKNFMVGF